MLWGRRFRNLADKLRSQNGWCFAGERVGRERVRRGVKREASEGLQEGHGELRSRQVMLVVIGGRAMRMRMESVRSELLK